jgi:hypothetical protein
MIATLTGPSPTSCAQTGQAVLAAKATSIGRRVRATRAEPRAAGSAWKIP